MTELAPRPPSPGLLGRELWPRTIRGGLASLASRTARGFSRQRAAAELITIAALPDELRTLIALTVGRTRLWGGERLDLARELIAHFTDGLQAGRAPGDLIADFGNPARAAKLIRRAKLRGRPLWWRTCAYSVRSFAVATCILLLVYAVLAYRFYFGRPTIRHNYAAELNAAVLAVPENQRAWPIYIQAARELGPTPQFILDGTPWPAHPGDPGWDAATAHLAAYPNAVPTIRKAAATLTLGFIYRNYSDPDFMRALEVRNPNYKYDPSQDVSMENPIMIGILLPYLSEFRNMTRVLQFDLAAATEAKDHARIVADIEAMLGMAEHCLHSGFLIDLQVSISIAEVATRGALRNLRLLTDQELTTVAHRFAAFAGGRVRIDPDRDAKMFEDLIQRFFTDDGHGDGHIIQGKIKELRTDFGLSNEEERRLAGITMPFKSAMIPSRAQIIAAHERILATIRVDEALPMWQSDQRSNAKGMKELYSENLRFMFPFESLIQDPSDTYRRMFTDRDLFEARRAGLLAACAIESHWRSHHAWPTDLATLVPALLPALPIDPFDGKAMRYKVSEQGPILYSVGMDQIDDGGQATTDPSDREHMLGLDARQLKAFRDPDAVPAQYRGDWIIYPPPTPASKP